MESDLTSENFEAPGRREARARVLELGWVEADAEALRFADGEFDVVTSSFGVILASDHRRWPTMLSNGHYSSFEQQTQKGGMMLGNAKVYATIGATDMSAAKEFYGQKLGLEVEKEDETGGVYYNCGNGPIYVYPSEHGGTNKGTCASWELRDIEGLAKELAAKGVRCEHYPELEGVELDGDIHNWGSYKVVWFKDPSGNILAADNGGA